MRLEINLVGYKYRDPITVAKVYLAPSKRFLYTNNGYSDVMEGCASDVIAVGDLISFVKDTGKRAAPVSGVTCEIWEVEVTKAASCPIGQISTWETKRMTGKIYDAVVVRTKTVPAGEGVSTGVQVSEVVHSKVNFSAPNDDVARAIVLSEAGAKAVKIDDELQPVEVKLRAWA